MRRATGASNVPNHLGLCALQRPGSCSPSRSRPTRCSSTSTASCTPATVSALQSMKQIQTILKHDGPNHLVPYAFACECLLLCLSLRSHGADCATFCVHVRTFFSFRSLTKKLRHCPSLPLAAFHGGSAAAAAWPRPARLRPQPRLSAAITPAAITPVFRSRRDS